VIYASDLMGSLVCTESGTKLGRVHDLRAHFDGDGWLLMGLVLGTGGIKERLSGGDQEPLGAGDVVAWEAITAIGDRRITVRDEIAAVVS
jgi:sporulation protein YlmC with PRC-barrel domain